jgi:hypothetical protein
MTGWPNVSASFSGNQSRNEVVTTARRAGDDDADSPRRDTTADCARTPNGASAVPAVVAGER